MLNESEGGDVLEAGALTRKWKLPCGCFHLMLQHCGEAYIEKTVCRQCYQKSCPEEL